MIAGIYPLRRICREKLLIEDKSRKAGQNWNADVFCNAGIYRRFVNHHVALAERLADGCGCLLEHAQVRLKRLIDRRWYGDDKKIDLLECLRIRGEADILGGGEFRLGHLAGAIPPHPQFRYPLGIHVKPKDRKVPAHMDGERQTDIAKPNDSNPDIIDTHQGHRAFHPNRSKLPPAAQRPDVKRMPTPKSSSASLQGRLAPP